jgi:hypothetical protein
MLKQLVALPTNQPLYAAYLSRLGFKRDQLVYYVKAGWLVRLHHGVYSRPGVDLSALQVLRATQSQLKAPLYVGGKSALSLQGESYAIVASPSYLVFCPPDFRVNAYLKTFANLSFRKNRQFPDMQTGVELLLDGLTVSSRERGILEMADEVSGDNTFEEFYNVMELLTSLRSSLLQTLLESSNSIKSKRIFLSVAARLNFKWYGNLDLSRVQLGSGSREIGRGGEYDRKFRIILPRLHNGL